jgi:hypothetical protein
VVTFIGVIVILAIFMAARTSATALRRRRKDQLPPTGDADAFGGNPGPGSPGHRSHSGGHGHGIGGQGHGGHGGHGGFGGHDGGGGGGGHDGGGGHH